jgi:hypothetical protein
MSSPDHVYELIDYLWEEFSSHRIFSDKEIKCLIGDILENALGHPDLTGQDNFQRKAQVELERRRKVRSVKQSAQASKEANLRLSPVTPVTPKRAGPSPDDVADRMDRIKNNIMGAKNKLTKVIKTPTRGINHPPTRSGDLVGAPTYGNMLR